MFDYSGKIIVSINEWESTTKIEILRVQNLRSMNSHWVIKHRPDKFLSEYSLNSESYTESLLSRS